MLGGGGAGLNFIVIVSQPPSIFKLFQLIIKWLSKYHNPGPPEVFVLRMNGKTMNFRTQA